VLKRPIIKHSKGVEMCSDIVEYVCTECAYRKSFDYESLVSEAIEYIRSYPINPCYWKNHIVASSEELRREELGRGFSIKELFTTKTSPITFIIVGLHPMASSLCSIELGMELATSLNEELRKLNADIVDKCNANFESVIDICLRLLEKPNVTIVYELTAYSFRCTDINQSTLKSYLDQTLNNIKSLFEEKVRRLYEEYQKKLQSYGLRRVEIDGQLCQALRLCNK